MIFSKHKSFYQNVVQKAIDEKTQLKNHSSVSGGCINNAVQLETSQGNFFLKWNSSVSDDMFEKEAKGLNLLYEADEIKTPKVYDVGELEDKKYILMEFVESEPQQGDFWEDFGARLASLHKNHVFKSYGLDHNNYIGSLSQHNNFNTSWIDFFREQRLEVQLKLAIKNGLVDENFVSRYRNFYDMLPNLLPESPPSLLHGDLWSGNFMTGSDGGACLIDPAVYYGNREIELSFTKMFGGFDHQFYQSYRENYPLDPGFDERVDIYNMYPSMVHVNLFGTSYLAGVERVLRRYL